MGYVKRAKKSSLASAAIHPKTMDFEISACLRIAPRFILTVEDYDNINQNGCVWES